jgi:histidinol-phosphate aminotransferase
MSDFSEKIEALIRPNIRVLKPYSSARDEAPEAAAISIHLDANENSFGGPLNADFSRYPDPNQRALKQTLAELRGVSANQIFVGNGSDEAIDLLFRAFVEPGLDNVVILPPTYGMYSVQANIHGAEIRQAPLNKQFEADAQAVRDVMDTRSKLLFICSPNNPTGQCLSKDFMLSMLTEFPGIVVIDEAYIDYTEGNSWVPMLEQFPNLVVLQTLSKAWGLAGLRIGMAYSNSLIINVLNKIKYPYNLNVVTTELALQALSMPEKVAENIAKTLSERRRLESELPRFSYVEEVFQSDANFLLVRVQDADRLYAYLSSHCILVRNRSRELHCENCLRITVGTGAENSRLLEVMGNYRL